MPSVCGGLPPRDPFTPPRPASSPFPPSPGRRGLSASSLASISILALFLVVALAALGPAPLAAQPIDWSLIPGTCTGDDAYSDPFGDLVSALSIACGDLGTLVVSSAGGLGDESLCSEAVHVGTPALYPRPSGLPVRRDPDAPWFPCVDGTCFGRGADTSRPWVAVVDWNDGHGWSVAGTILEASAGRVDVVLQDVESLARFPAFAGQAVGDLHLIDSLCGIAQHVADHPADAPAVVNLSLGRVDDGLASCDASSDSLGCLLRSVLDHLVVDLGVPVVAAAGNHGTPLFPASHAPVLSAGSLNLARLTSDGTIEPSSETPVGVDILVPGYGVYLEAPDGSLWPAPAGSSYAAALASGWLAGVDPDRSTVPVHGSWWPQRALQRPSNFWVLRHVSGYSVSQSSTGGASALVDRAVGMVEVGSCPSYDEHTLALVLGLPAALSVPPVDAIDPLSGPQPGTRPCLPCYGEEPPPDPDGDDGGTSNYMEIPPRWNPDFYVDLSKSYPVPEDWTVAEIRLRIGPAVYRLHEAVPNKDLTVVDRFSEATVRNLLIEGVGKVKLDGDQVSLVYIIEDAKGQQWWDVVPIHVATPSTPRQCGEPALSL